MPAMSGGLWETRRSGNAVKTTINGRKVVLKDSFKEHVLKKLSRFDRFFGDDAEAHVTVTVEHERQIVEITIRYKEMIYRAEQVTTDMLPSFDQAVDAILKQIDRNKTRLSKRLKAGAFEKSAPVGPEPDYEVVKVKKFPIKPMDPEEAILQMNLLGHQFFAFINLDTNNVNVVYRRHDGTYGVLEPVAG